MNEQQVLNETSEKINLKDKWAKALSMKKEKEEKGKEIISSAFKKFSDKGEEASIRDKAHPYKAPPTRALQEGRKAKMGLDKNINRTQVVNLAGTLSEQPGFYCSVCDCILKSSDAYLDHCNGRRHQKLMGYSLRVKRSTLEEVQARLQKITEAGGVVPPEQDLEAKWKEMDEEKERRKQLKKEAKKKKKEEQEHTKEIEITDEMREFGFDFASFGSSKKT